MILIKTKNIKKVTLEINPKILVNSVKLFKLLMHEMLHAYNNYISYFKDAPLTIFDISNSDKYKKTLKDSKSIPEIRVKQILQVFSKIELNAYASELYLDLEIGLKNKIKINGYVSYKDALELLEKTDHYISFVDVSKYLQNIPEKDKEIFVKDFNNISQTNYNWNKVYKKCIYYLNRYERKISEIPPKYYYDIVKENIKNESYLDNNITKYNIELANINNKEKHKYVFGIQCQK